MTTATTNTKTMSVTRALTTLKGLNEKINEAIINGTFVSVLSGTNRTPANIDAAKSKVQASHDSLKGLIDRRIAIKDAIVKSNAETMVDFRGAKITVASAIEQRDQLVTVMKSYLARMVAQYNEVTSEQTRAVSVVNANVARAEQTIYGKETASAERQSELDTMRKAQERQYGVDLIDPVQIEKKIAETRALITDLDVELDALLSESNARTNVEIPV